MAYGGSWSKPEPVHCARQRVTEMTTDTCCRALRRELTPATRSGRSKGLADGIAAILSGVALMLMPKCPACLAAYLALGTGIGLSISSADGIRIALIATFTALLVFSTARAFRRLWSHSPRLARRD